VFAVHPIQVEAVAWVTGRKDLLAGLFSLAALWQYLEWRLASLSQLRGRESAVPSSAGAAERVPGVRGRVSTTSLLLVPLLSRCCASRRQSHCAGCHGAGLLRDPAPVARITGGAGSLFVLAGVVTVVTMLVQPVPSDFTEKVPVWYRPFVAGQALLFYTTKIVYPHRFAVVYGLVPWAVFESSSGYFVCRLPLLR